MKYDWCKSTILQKVRGGFGVFYDLATSQIGEVVANSYYPFGAAKFLSGESFPLTSATAAPAPITLAGSGQLSAFDPHLQLPYTLQWNVALEQALGREQTIQASYVGASGRRLLASAFLLSINPNYSFDYLFTNGATSDYDALQLQFQRRLSHGLQALASYTWAHSIDTGSAASFGNGANQLLPGLNPNANRGPSDFDIRSAFSASVTYAVPAVRVHPFLGSIVHGWSVENIVQARSAPPVDVFDGTFFALGNASTNIRPDAIPGQSFYLYGPQYPGGRALNPAAFAPPPTDPVTGAPLRQGNLSRNALRAFGASQWDFAVHRDFSVYESMKLQFRAEMFNLLNHPNFGPPIADISNQQFGLANQMLGQSLAGFGSTGAGGLSPLYQIGGPRSIQFALKLIF